MIKVRNNFPKNINKKVTKKKGSRKKIINKLNLYYENLRLNTDYSPLLRIISSPITIPEIIGKSTIKNNTIPIIYKNSFNYISNKFITS